MPFPPAVNLYEGLGMESNGRDRQDRMARPLRLCQQLVFNSRLADYFFHWRSGERAEERWGAEFERVRERIMGLS